METNYVTHQTIQMWSASVTFECIIMPKMSWHFKEQDAINLSKKRYWIINNAHKIQTQQSRIRIMQVLWVCATTSETNYSVYNINLKGGWIDI